MKAQVDSTFWYDYFGNADYWLHQPDAFAFKTFGGSAYTGWIDTTTVDSVVFQSGRNDKANEVYFKSSASAAQVQAQIVSFYQSGQVQYTYPVITKNPFLQNYMKKWYVMDNLLLVSFRDSVVDSDTLDAFMNRYNLTLYSGPDPNAAVPYHYFPYIFKIGVLSKDIPDYAEYAQIVYEREFALVEAVSPNIVNIPINGKAYPVSNSIGSNPNQQCVTSDTHFADLWHIDNDTWSYSGFPSGTQDADANVCGCWTAGYTGVGVKVAAIGDGYFDDLHEDMVGVFEPGWDCSTGNCVPLAPNHGQWYQNGVMGISGVVAANHDNVLGISGVAYDAKIIPIKIDDDNGTTSLAAVAAALGQARVKGANISATNFFTEINDGPIYSQVNTYGDADMLLVAPSGYGNVASVQNYYPAAYPFNFVVGVIPSTANDELATLANSSGPGSWGTNVAANYGNQYDVAAPGVRVWVTQYMTGNSGYGTEVVDIGIGAVGVTAGIAAIIWDKNSTLLNNQVKGALVSGAEKVGGYNYVNGKSMEMANGRVDCEASILNVVSIDNPTLTQSLTVLNPFTESLTLLSKASFSGKIILTDVSGKLILQKQITFTERLSIDLPALSSGLYFLQFQNTSNTQTIKLLKP